MVLLRFIKDYWSIVLALGGLLWFNLLFVLVGAWTLYKEPIVGFARKELGIEKLATLVGANKVVYQPPGQTYVREPVHIGEQVKLVLTIRRTEVGSGCTYISTVPIFTDSNGVKLPSSFSGPGRQIGTELNTAELVISLPDTIQPGRTTLELQLNYICGGIPVPELTNPAVFNLMPRKE